MPLYEYRCPRCGVFERLYPMNTAPQVTACTGCNGQARKIISAITLSHSGSAAMKAIDAAAASAHQPQVITARPPASSSPPPTSRSPLHAKLPRH